jgi:hypothetical protein
MREIPFPHLWLHGLPLCCRI